MLQFVILFRYRGSFLLRQLSTSGDSIHVVATIMIAAVVDVFGVVNVAVTVVVLLLPLPSSLSSRSHQENIYSEASPGVHRAL